MNLREKYLETLRREKDRPVPYFFCLCQTLVKKFREQHGHVDYRDYYDIPLREVFLNPTRLDPKKTFERYISPEEKDPVTEWGIVLRQGGEESHFTQMEGPLENRRNTSDVLGLPLPDFLEDYRWKGVPEKIASMKKQGKIIFPGIYGGHDSGCSDDTTPAFMDIFESSWYLCGLDNFLMGMADEEEYALTLLDRVCDLKTQLARRWTEAGVDILITADDVGSQNGLMMSADMWRRHLKPRLKKVINAAKSINPDVLIFYHSDGNITKIIPELLEVGVEILNPLQPECMDIFEVMETYGDKCSFWGTIGTQTTLPFGSAADVTNACNKVLAKVAGKGGLVLAPTHLVEPEVPLQNITAMVDCVGKYNESQMGSI